jgi:CBS domain containing-hemolysin-like protein
VTGEQLLRAAEGADASNNVDAPIRPKRIHHMVPVAETTDLEDALALMRRSGRHLAQVRNASGEVTGVLFLEDIIEELVGEVHDATRRGH